MNYRENIERIAREYHASAAEPDMFIENAVQGYEAEWVLQRVPAGSRFLELGVGDGVTMNWLSPHFDYEVVEGTLALVEKAKVTSLESTKPFKVHHSWFEEFEPDDRFDVVYASHVLEHVEKPVELLRKMATWLRPSGELVIIVPNSESMHRRLGVNLGLQSALESLSQRDVKVGHLRVYSADTLSADLKSAGFNIATTRGFFVKPLANSQLTHLEPRIISALCSISDDVDPRICANLCVVAKLP